MRNILLWRLAGLVFLLLTTGAGVVRAQVYEMNFFVIPVGPTWGANQSSVTVSDENCQQTAYALGLGDPPWVAYMTGSAEEGEADKVARDRIGTGPWYNYYGVMIAENLAQLHSDENNLNAETAITIAGEYVDPAILAVPPGSELDGSDFTRAGPYFCFSPDR